MSAHRVFVYQTQGSTGRGSAKWHAPSAAGRAACTDLPIAAETVARGVDVPEQRRCRSKACALRWPVREAS